MGRGVIVLWLLAGAPACGARTGLVPGDAAAPTDGDADADADADGDADGDGDCDVDPSATGCPCDEGAVEACYSGPDGTASQGECRAGVRVCLGVRWGACDGEVLPRAEECDDVDDDCDGAVDEDGVCPPCGRFLTAACFGPGPECERWGDGPGLASTAEGDLTVADATDDATWTGTLAFECITGNFRVVVDASVPGQADVRVRYRGAQHESDLADTEWLDLGTIPPDGPSFDLNDLDEYPHVAQLQTVLHRADAGPPVLHRVDVCWYCEFF